MYIQCTYIHYTTCNGRRAVTNNECAVHYIGAGPAPWPTHTLVRSKVPHNIQGAGVRAGPKKRAKLPRCVERRIRELYADPELSATHVGYKQQ